MELTTGHVFIATSLDGFIARPNGDIDWLLARDVASEDHGYERFIAGMDGIVMGRNTFEKARTLGAWSYPVPTWVLSSKLAGTQVPSDLAGRVAFTEEAPQRLLARLRTEGLRRVYVDGGQLIQSCLRAGLVQDLVVTQIPVLLGHGLPLFGALDEDVALEHLSTQSFPSGLVQSHYRVVR